MLPTLVAPDRRIASIPAMVAPMLPGGVGIILVGYSLASEGGTNRASSILSILLIRESEAFNTCLPLLRIVISFGTTRPSKSISGVRAITSPGLLKEAASFLVPSSKQNPASGGGTASPAFGGTA